MNANKQQVKVFVYGALMGHPLILSKAITARLENHELRFSVKGFPPFEPAFAEIVEHAGKTVWGCMTELSIQQWQIIKKIELGYIEKKVAVITPVNEKEYDCFALIRKKASLTHQEFQPSARYMGKLLKNARRYCFPEAIIQSYQNLYQRGNRLTYYIPWFLPMFKLLYPYCGAKTSYYTSLLSPLVLLFLVGAIYIVL